VPVTIEYRPNGVILWHRDVITDDMLLQANQAIYEHDYPQGMRFQIVELSGVTSYDVTADTMRRLAEMDVQQGPDALACAIAPDDLTYGMCRIWITMADDGPLNIEIFRNPQDATAWLSSHGIDVELTYSNAPD